MFCPFGRDKFGRTAAATAEDLEYGDEEKQTPSNQTKAIGFVRWPIKHPKTGDQQATIETWSVDHTVDCVGPFLLS